MLFDSTEFPSTYGSLFYPSASQFAVKMILQIVGSPLLGIIMAKCVMFWLSYIFNDGLIEITITLATAYITFYIGKKHACFC